MQVDIPTARPADRASAYPPTASIDARRRLLLAIPAVIALHNAEEALTVPRFLPRMAHVAPAAVRPMVADLSPRGFLVALAVVTVLPVLFVALGDLRRGRRTAFVLLATAAVMLVNVGVHLGAAVWLGGYAPGVATALAVNLPFFVCVVRRAWRERWIGRRAFRWLAPIGVAIHGLLPLLLRLTSG